MANKRLWIALGLLALATAAIVGVVIAARTERSDPDRCPHGSVALGARCCGVGQHLKAGHCEGRPTACPVGARIGTDGCLPNERKVRISGGRVEIGPSDWEARAQTDARTLSVTTFIIDSHEVTELRWSACVKAGRCRALPETELGRPVRGVSVKEAESFCHFVGGHLPRVAQWIFAAAGTAARRYPWGQTGLVCRRAVFGLVDGPCAGGGDGPEVTGFRPDGTSPDGVADLAGNVAEWVREDDGTARAYGGSYQSVLAGSFKSWAGEARPAAEDVGFRCVYEVGGTSSDADP